MKKIISNTKARQAILQGTQKLSNIVGITLGPRGRNVVLERENGTPLITNDGVTIARSVELPDKHENMAAKILLQASSQTNQNAGDGTTSAIVLGAELVKLGLRAIELGQSPVTIKDELLTASKQALAEVDKISIPVNSHEEIISIATNSCGNPNDGELVARAFQLAGLDGVVTLDENNTGETTLRHNDGCEITATLATPYMIENPARMETTYDNAHILLTDTEVKTPADLLPILEHTAKNSLRLVIVAPSFSAEALQTLLLNRVRANVKVLATTLRELDTRTQATLEDLAALTGATLVTNKNDLAIATTQPEHLGFVEKITCGTNLTILSKTPYENPIENPIEKRKNIILAQIEQATDDYSKTRLRERLAKLTQGIAVISVGAPTDIEMGERKLRIEDAIAAVRAAAAEGTVDGAGTTYLTLSNTVKNEILSTALKSIPRRIISNADENPDMIMSKIDNERGYDARTKAYCNLRKNNIIDPARVIKQVIQNAASAAATLLTTDGMIC